MEQITSESFTLRTEKGGWLAQVVLTSDGMFASVSDYGNFSYAWRSFGDNFKEFIKNLDVSYFGGKMYNGISYIAYGRKYEAAAYRFAEEILPALKKAISEQGNRQKDNE